MSNPHLAAAQLLDRLDVHSYTMHVTDRTYYSARLPDSEAAKRVDIRLTIVSRSDFMKVCAELKCSPKERIVNAGQRAWWAESDSPGRRLLIEGVSFQHHDDWLAKGEEPPAACETGDLLDLLDPA